MVGRNAFIPTAAFLYKIRRLLSGFTGDLPSKSFNVIFMEDTSKLPKTNEMFSDLDKTQRLLLSDRVLIYIFIRQPNSRFC